jgi:DNA repair exonuclease SbcCD ATPase subunit
MFIAYQNTTIDGVQVEQASFVADTRETFQPPMYGLRSDYEDLFTYEAELTELTARKKAAVAALDSVAIAAAETEQYKAADECAAIGSQLEAATKAEEKDEAKIVTLTEAHEKAKAKLAAIIARLAELRAPVTKIETEINALVNPGKTLPFVLIDRIEEHEGRAKIVGGKVLFDTDIDVSEMKALEEQYTAQVQAMLDEAAKALGYDSCLSVCSYIETGVEKFDKEGVQFRRWRSAIWARGYQLLDEVKSGVRAVPTPEELPGLMPKLEEFEEK